jgi:cytochrome c
MQKFILTFLVASSALSADADSGKRLAQARCTPCHAIEPNQSRQITEAPPFETIAGKYAGNPQLLAFSLLDPHPRMNVTLTRRDIEELVAYIGSFAK